MESNAPVTAGAPPPILAVFARAPILGAVKTRLARTIGQNAALKVYETMVRHVWAQAASDTFRRWLFYAPEGAGAIMGEWLPEADHLVAQSSSASLGDRLERAFACAFEAGAERAAVVGTDLPGLSTAHLDETFRLLDTHSAVMGPSRDGGFWILALRAPGAVDFSGVRWGTEWAGADMRRNLADQGHRIALTSELTDVDTLDDLLLFPELAAAAGLTERTP